MGTTLKRETVDSIIEHMRSHAHKAPDGREFPNLYPLLAKALANRCQPYADQAKQGGGKYRPLAKELPSIAEKLGIKGPLRERGQDIDVTMEIVERARIDMSSKGSKSNLAPAMLVWLWQTDEPYTRRFLRQINFDLAAAEANELAHVEAAGVASNSPYTLLGQIEATTSRLVLIAQNHWHMVSTEDRHGYRYWPILLNALKRGIDIDVVAMHPEIGPRGRVEGPLPASAVDAWALFMHTPEFPTQLKTCWERFAQWHAFYCAARDEAGGSSTMGAFRALGAYFTPVTMSVIDPDDQDGMIVVSPRVGDPKSASRPQFAIYKDTNPEGFTYYWSYIENALADHHWVKILG